MWAYKVKYSMLVVPVFKVFRMFQNKSIYYKESILNKKYKTAESRVRVWCRWGAFGPPGG